jgi:DNA-binding IclR family transcriptional regulator
MKQRVGTPQSVTGRVLIILTAFGSDRPSLSLSEISRLTNLPASTTCRLLAEMTEWGALIRGADRRYWVGPRLVELAAVAPPSSLLAS